jgi:hypothetical protein
MAIGVACKKNKRLSMINEKITSIITNRINKKNWKLNKFSFSFNYRDSLF